MKLRHLVLGLTLLGCTPPPEPDFPYEPTKVIDPIGPNENEKMYLQAEVKFEIVLVMKCLSSVYKSSNTISVTQHCVGNNEGRYWAYRYSDENKDGVADEWCNVSGTTVVGGLDKEGKWDCHDSKRSLSDLLQKAERWYNDPYAVW